MGPDIGFGVWHLANSLVEVEQSLTGVALHLHLHLLEQRVVQRPLFAGSAGQEMTNFLMTNTMQPSSFFETFHLIPVVTVNALDRVRTQISKSRFLDVREQSLLVDSS
jgi:hypothetical protein